MGKKSKEVEDQSEDRTCVWLHDQQYERNIHTNDRHSKSQRGYRFDEPDIQYEPLFAACRVRYVQEDKILKSVVDPLK